MKRSKLLFVIFAAAISAAALCACTDDKPQESAKSGLTGTYTYQETLGVTEADAVRITHDENNALERAILSTVYPINSGLEGARVSYNMDQRLKLKRDYTYEYEYSVVLGNPGDWGQRFASFTVSIGGTFTYEKISDGLYTVGLPLSFFGRAFRPRARHAERQIVPRDGRRYLRARHARRRRFFDRL